MKLRLSSSVILVFIISSCEGPLGPRDHMAKSFKDYTIFPDGSYWVYKEFAKDSIDSIYQFKTEFHNDLNFLSGPRFQSWAFSFGSKNDSLKRYLGFETIDSDKNTFTYKAIEDSPDPNNRSYSIFFDNALVNDISNFNTKDTLSFYDSIPEYTARGLQFGHVKIFEHNDKLMKFPALTKRVYVAKNVGIIRRELFNGEIWELTKYNINN